MTVFKRLFENKGKANFTLVKETGHNSKKYSRISYKKFMKLEDLLFYPFGPAKLLSSGEMEFFTLISLLVVNIVLTVLQPM